MFGASMQYLYRTIWTYEQISGYYFQARGLPTGRARCSGPQRLHHLIKKVILGIKWMSHTIRPTPYVSQ
jgi:hypothetical protein